MIRGYGGKIVWNKFRFMLVLVGIGIFFNNAHAQNDSWTEIRIEPTRDIDSTLVHVTFHRSKSSRTQLILTGLKLTGKKSSHISDPVELIEFSSNIAHLAAWFVIQEKGKELWLGTQLEAGSISEAISIKIPGALRELGGASSLIEMVVDLPESMIASFSDASPNFIYAPVKELSISVPTWLNVTEHTGWTRATGDEYPRFIVSDGLKDPGAKVLVFERSSYVEAWLDKALPKYFVALMFSVTVVLVLVEMGGGISVVIRSIIAVSAVVLFVVLLEIGDWHISNWKNVLFSGAHVMGFMTGLVILFLLPSNTYPRLRDFFKQLKQQR